MEYDSRRLISPKLEKIKRDSEKIVELFNNLNVLVDPFKINIEFKSPEKGPNGEIAVASLMQLIHPVTGLQLAGAAVVYIIKNDLVESNGGGVGSLGVKLGTLLFHLQMLAVYNSGTQIYYLNNATDEPERAALGIYSLLEVDKTLKGYATEPRSSYTGLTLAEQLHVSEGGMRGIIGPGFFEKWQSNMIELGGKIHNSFNQKDMSPWSLDCKAKINSFLLQVKQTGLDGFGVGPGMSGGFKFSKKRKSKRKKGKPNRKKRKSLKKKRKSKRKRL